MLSLQTYFFQGLDSASDQRCLPLGFAFAGSEPDPRLACDLAECEIDDNSAWRRLNCGHSFHNDCVSLVAECPICTPLLIDKIQSLAIAFNAELMADKEQGHPDEEDGDGDNGDDDGDDDDDDDDDEDGDNDDRDGGNGTEGQPVDHHVPTLKADLKDKLQRFMRHATTPLLPQHTNAKAAPAPPPPPAPPAVEQPIATAAPKDTPCEVCGKKFTKRGISQHVRRSHADRR